MLKLYKENAEFDEYTKFDTNTGKLIAITKEEFFSFIPDNYKNKITDEGINRIETKDAMVFFGETSETHTRFPRKIYFQITRNCNLNCDYCFIKAKKGEAHVPTEAIKELAKEMGINGLIEVRLTGGEPTTHPDFLEILDEFQKNHVYVSIATNGIINKQILEEIAKRKNIYLICSIDGKRETHNKYRPGTFDKIIENLKYLKENNPEIRIRLTTVLTKENKDEMHELGKICKEVDAESITLIPLRPQLRDQSMMKQIINGEEFKKVIEDMLKVKKELGINFTTTLETEFKKEIYKDPVYKKRSSCAAGREGTNLDYNAKTGEFIVYGCSYSPAADLQSDPIIRKPFLAGAFSSKNISKFLDIWRDEANWTIFRDLILKSEECKNCAYLKNHTCTGSCPIQNIDYAKIRVDKNILSQLKEQLNNTGEWYCYQKIFHSQ